MSEPEQGEEKRFVSVSIPRSLIDDIDRIIASGKFGYGSRSEFIKDAIRRRLEELRPLR